MSRVWIGLSCLAAFGCATSQPVEASAPDSTPRLSFRDEVQIREALRAAGVGPHRRVQRTDETYADGLLVYEACTDAYSYGDRPGHPSEPCASRTKYLVSSPSAGMWFAVRFEPRPPPFYDCFPYVQIDGGPWDDAEVGLKIPRG